VGGKSKSFTVGYRYKMGLHFVLCRGPVDEVSEIIAGERTAWTGPVTDNTTITIDNAELFGGDKREGGILGDADILFGRPDQTQNGYLLSQLGSVLSAFRGVVSCVFKGGRVTSNNPYIKPWWFRVQRIHVAGDGTDSPQQWYDETAEVPLTVGGPENLIATHLVNIDALTNAAPTTPGMKLVSAADIDGLLPTDVLSITANTEGSFIAWSRFGVPAYSGGLTGSTYHFDVVLDDASLAIEAYTDSGQLDGYAEARDLFVAQQPVILSGASRYRFGLIDDPIDDNTGGVSLIVRVYRGLDFGAMNPAHIIREVLTDPYFRQNYPEAMIDDVSFTAAADTFFAEGMGLCFFWNMQSQSKAFIQTVLDHCGAVYYADPYTGKFVLTPIRGDYTPALLDIYDESSIIDLERFDRPGPGEIVNEITVVYIDVVTGKEATVTVQDNAHIQIQGSIVARTTQYPGLPTADLAARVAQRDLTASTAELAQFKIKFTREAWPLRPGGVFKLSWAKLGISEAILRVLDIDYGLLEDGIIQVSAAEDVFGLPSESFQADQPSGWEEPDTTPVAVVIEDVAEASYWDVQRQLDPANLATLDADAGFVSTLAARPSTGVMGYSVHTRIDPAAYELRTGATFAPTALLYDPVVRSDTMIVIGSENNFSSSTVEVGERLQIGTGREAEFVEVTDTTDLDAYGTIVVNRGILDTTPQEHIIGARVWLVEDEIGQGDNYGQEGIERATYDVVDVKLTTFSGTGESLLGEAAEMSLTLDQRFYRPYAPGNVLIAGDAFPYVEVNAGAEITWAHRDRLQQTASYIAQSEASIGPEYGTTYNLYIYDDDTEALEASQLAIDDDVYVLDIPGNFTARLELEAVRDGVVSWQRQIRVFDYVGSLPELAAMVTDSATTTLLGNQNTTINFDTETLDEGGYFTAPSTDLTVPTGAAGWHYISNNFSIDAGSPARYSNSAIIPGGGTAWVTNLNLQYERSTNATFNHTRSLGHLVKLADGSNANSVHGVVTTNRTMAAGGKFNIARVPNNGAAAGAATLRTTAQSIAATTETAITFTTEVLDEGAMIDIAGQPTRVTITSDGWYLAVSHADWATTATYGSRNTSIRLNGSGAWFARNTFVSGEVSGSVTLPTYGIGYLTNGDYLEVMVRHSEVAGNRNVEACYLTAAKVETFETIGAHVSYAGSAQTVNTGSDVLITFDTENRDDDNMVNLGAQAGRITVSENGWYAIAGHVGTTLNTGGLLSVILKVDGSTVIAQQNCEGFVDFVLNVTSVTHLTAGQYVSLYVNAAANTATLIGNDRPKLALVLLAKDN
jgi:hypothetical protein